MSKYKLVPNSIVDELAQFIRQVDGNNRMGAGTLADKICERFSVASPAVQGEPDVSALVEALEACRDELLWMIERHNQQDQNDGSWLYDHQTVVDADAALAAHRMQGDQP